MARNPELSSLPPAPDVTPGYAAKRLLGRPALKAALDIGSSLLAQTALQKTAQAAKLLGEVTPASLKDFLPIGETGKSTALQSLMVAAGVYVSEFITDAFIRAKTKVGLEPDNYLLRKAWQLSIRLQAPSIIWSSVKSGAAFTEHPELFDNQGSFGVYLSLVSGGTAILDNFIPRTEKGEIRDLIVPTAILAGGLLGYFLTPNELKPNITGGVVAALANFTENTAEVMHLSAQRSRRR